MAIPWYLLDRIAEHGDRGEREAALETLAKGEPPPSRRPDPVAGRRIGDLERRVFDAGNVAEVVTAKPVRREGDPVVGDDAVDDIYEALGAVHTFFWEVFRRDSIDDEGLPLTAVVHYGHNFANMFWSGTELIVGDGDGHVFLRFSRSLEVVAHELCHALQGLVYVGQSGALNESFCDILGSLVKQYALRQRVEEADWLMGTEILPPSVTGAALRSLKAPGTAYDDDLLGRDPQPAHMNDYVNTANDNGGVHINSGIPNRAFYIAATTLGGFAWDYCGRIWYEAAQGRYEDVTFSEFADNTLASAARLYGNASAEVEAVRSGWSTVGVIHS